MARQHSIVTGPEQPLIGIIREQDGHPVVVYFTEEEAADGATGTDTTAVARSLVGAWSDLAWGETVKALDRRHG